MVGRSVSKSGYCARQNNPSYHEVGGREREGGGANIPKRRGEISSPISPVSSIEPTLDCGKMLVK